MSEQRDGGPAFPHAKYCGADSACESLGGLHSAADGMTLRDWFAGMVSQSIVRKLDWEKSMGMGLEEAYRRVAATSYGLADAMLRDRDRVAS